MLVLPNRGYGSLGHLNAHSFQYTNAIQGSLVQETTCEYNGKGHSAITHDAYIGKMYCGLCHLDGKEESN
jgi:hypothetical protein